MSDIDKIVGQLKDISELQAYADAQYTTIVKQNKTINELQDKVKSLELVVAGISTPGSNIVQFPMLNISPEEEICIKQLEMLRLSSSGRELTLEEARKTEIYTKILTTIRSNIKDVNGKFEKVSTDELLKLTQALPNDAK